MKLTFFINLDSFGEVAFTDVGVSIECDGLYVESAVGAVCSEDLAHALLQNRRSFV